MKPLDDFFHKLALVPFLRPLFLLIAGICFEVAFHLEITGLAILIVFILPLFFFRKTVSLGIWGLIVIFGMFTVGMNTPQKDVPRKENLTLQAVVAENPYLKNGKRRSRIDILHYREGNGSWHRSSEKLQVYIDTSYTKPVSAGDTLLFTNGFVRDIENGSLPFDWAGYMFRRGITGQVSLKPHQIIGHSSHKGFHPVFLAKKAQRHCVAVTAKMRLDRRSQSVLSAILWGDKTMLDPDIRQDYSRTGIAHLLAISGLHVGLVYMMLNVFFFWCNGSYRLRIFKMVSILVTLWIYAFITGLSPSVCRAALMFSLFRLTSFSITHPVNRYNVLFASAFILLAADPFYLYDIGFQLSYLSVFSIMFFTPRIRSQIPRPSNKMLLTVYNAALYTVSAQICILPLLLLYFGQLPLVSVFTNIVLVLFTTPVMLLGTTYLLFPAEVIAAPTRFVLAVQDRFVSAVSSWKYASLENIAFDKADCLLCYMALAIIMLYIEIRHPRRETLADYIGGSDAGG